MKRFLIFLTVYTAASALSWLFYIQLWHVLWSLDYAITVLMHLLFGPLGDIGLYPNSSTNTGILDVWAIKTAILFLLVALACFRPEKRNRVFWWSASVLFWLLMGVTTVFYSA